MLKFNRKNIFSMARVLCIIVILGSANCDYYLLIGPYFDFYINTKRFCK